MRGQRIVDAIVYKEVVTRHSGDTFTVDELITKYDLDFGWYKHGDRVRGKAEFFVRNAIGTMAELGHVVRLHGARRKGFAVYEVTTPAWRPSDAALAEVVELLVAA